MLGSARTHGQVVRSEQAAKAEAGGPVRDPSKGDTTLAWGGSSGGGKTW